MTRQLVCLIAVTAVAGAAYGQQTGYPVPGPINYLPYYSGLGQPNAATGRPPLSPYLNLLNGNNPALNYYYGVRPLLPNNSTTRPPQQLGGPMTPQNGPGFVSPANITYSELDPDVDPSKAFQLPPAGGPASYGNVFGSSRTGVPSGAIGGPGAGSQMNRGSTTRPMGPARRR